MLKLGKTSRCITAAQKENITFSPWHLDFVMLPIRPRAKPFAKRSIDREILLQVALDMHLVYDVSHNIAKVSKLFACCVNASQA